MADFWPSREAARPRNVPDWMVDRLDEYTSMPSGTTYAKKPYDEVLDEARLSELRRQQASLQDEKRRLDGTPQNLIFAGGALAAPALLLGSEFAGGFGFRAARAVRAPAEFNIFPRRRALNRTEKGPIWKEARKVFGRANGMTAVEMGTPDPPSGLRAGDKPGARHGQVHHRGPNEHANTLPGADPNRLANLQAIPKEVHEVVTAEWRKLLNALGRQPTPAEEQKFIQKMDRFIEPYTLRRGLPRPPPRVQKLPKGTT